jgi:hypothetical protein
VSEWNVWAKEISTQNNRNKIESFVEPYTIWFKPTIGKFGGKVVSEEYARWQVVFNSIGSSRQKVVCEWGNNVEDNGEESSDSGDSSLEATVPIKARSKGALNSYFKGKKWRNKQHYKEIALPLGNFQRFSSRSGKNKFLDMTKPNYKTRSTLEENNRRGWFLTFQGSNIVLKLQYYN